MRLKPDAAALLERQILGGEVDAVVPPKVVGRASDLGWVIYDDGKDVQAWPELTCRIVTGAALSPDEIDTTLMLLDVIWVEFGQHEDERSRRKSWEESYGRLLVTGVGILSCSFWWSSGDPENQDHVWDQMMNASGAYSNVGWSSGAWCSLHALIDDYGKWSVGNDVTEVLRVLEHGESAFSRGDALSILLDKAAAVKIVTIAGISRDIREELSVRSAMLLSPGGRERRMLLELEHLCIQYAVRMSDQILKNTIDGYRKAGIPDPSVEEGWSIVRAREVWHVARWMFGIFVRSPFYGRSLSEVCAYLRTHLPEDADPKARCYEALHPANFSVDPEEGLSIEEMGILMGLVQHLKGSPNNMALKLPGPVLHWLVRLASRRCTSREMEIDLASRSYISRGDPDEPTTMTGRWGIPVAPPMLARWILTIYAKMGWLHVACEEAQSEVVGMLAGCGKQDGWAAVSVMREGDKLCDEAYGVAYSAWSTRSNEPTPEVAMVGIGLIHKLGGFDLERLFSQLCALEDDWSVRLLTRFITGVKKRQDLPVVDWKEESRNREPSLLWRAILRLTDVACSAPDVNDDVVLAATVGTIEALNKMPPDGSMHLTYMKQSFRFAFERPPLSSHPDLRVAFDRRASPAPKV